MFENVIRFTAKVEDKASHWFIENGTPIEVAEKMCMQFIQMLGQIKIQNDAQRQAQENVPDCPTTCDVVQEPPKQE